MSKPEFLFSHKELPLIAFQTFSGMRLNGDLCDVTFVVADVRISAHRLVLAANIPYFRTLFVNNMTQSSTNEISLQQVEPSTLESLIYFAYNGELSINKQNVKSLLIGASLLLMYQVSDACCEYILKHMDHSNALDIREFSTKHNFTKLKNASDKFVQKHFTEISRTSAFLLLPFSDVKELFDKDEVHVANEETVYQAAIAWVKESPDDREDKLPELLTAVRMPFLSYDFLLACCTSEALIQKSPACWKLLQEAKDHCVLSDQTVPCSFCKKPRNFPSYKASYGGNYIYAVCSFMKGYNSTVVERYEAATGKWKMMNARTACVTYASIVAIGKCIYLIGGENSIGRCLDSVLMYDSALDTWSKKASLEVKKKLISSAVHSNKIFACGGVTAKGIILSSVECYYPEEDEWTRIPDMLECRGGACSVSLDECIYVLGGYGGLPCYDAKLLCSVERYSVETGQWTLISPMSCALYRKGAASLNGKIFIHGKEFLEVYEPWLEEWDRISDVREDKSGFTMLTFNDKFYVVGGSNSRRVDIYDLERSEWREEKPLPEQLFFIGAAKVSMHCHV